VDESFRGGIGERLIGSWELGERLASALQASRAG